ncbi:MAG TPA: PQQ-binding-like beta-propeller repeat protein, partial [Ktedonobacteraceae bacterium]|nr:PQQ-binding-like beta-propeller repeat protein [Ktedonobacteraceae bacterium]
MDKHPPDFTEELVDAQIDWLLADQSLPQTDSPNKRIVDDLQHIYQDDERSLHKVWLRLGLEESQQSMEHPGDKYPEDTLDGTHKMQRSASARPSTERHRPMQQVQKRSLVHTFSLMAAVCTLVLIIGSFLLVFNLIHQNLGPNTATNVTTQNIYASDNTSVFMLNTQTHQTIWKKPFTNVAKIIREGQVLYIMQGNLGRGEPNTVLKLDARNGQTLWTHPFPTRQGHGDVFLTDMLLLNGRLYISSYSRNDNPVLDNPVPISILNATNGNQVTTIPGEKDVWNMTLNSDVLATSSSAGIRVSDIAEGRQLWQKSLKSSSSFAASSMQLVNGLLYVVVTANDGEGDTTTSTIRAYKISNGQQVWQ